MKANWSVLSLLAAAFALAPISCGMQPPDAGGSLDKKNLDALPDEDGDGLPELETPKGVDASQMLGIEFISEITQDQAGGLVPEGLGGLLGLISVELSFEVTLNYEGGLSVVHEGTRDLDEFRLAFEAACPESVTVKVSVSALGGLFEQTLLQGDFSTTATMPGDIPDLPCDSVLRIRAFIDEQGSASVETSVDPQ